VNKPKEPTINMLDEFHCAPRTEEERKQDLRVKNMLHPLLKVRNEETNPVLRFIKRRISRYRYNRLWTSPLGKDCVSLDTSLCKWLGDRLIFLATYTQSAPIGHTDMRWRRELAEHGQALLAWDNHFELDAEQEEAAAYAHAQKAMRWVATHLGKLWD